MASRISDCPVRLLKFWPISNDVPCQIYQTYFEQFGVVISMDYNEGNSDTHIGYVEFKSAEAAEEALQKSIINHNINVEVAEMWRQPDQIVNKLCDECLILIFSKLRLVDLTNAANVCVRFSHVAEFVFTSKYKKIQFNNECGYTHNDAKSAIETFGPLIREIDIQAHFVPELDILSLLAEHCSSLVQINFNEYDFTTVNFVETNFARLLYGLQSLTFDACLLPEHMLHFLSFCRELKCLKIGYCSIDINIFKAPVVNQLTEIHLVNSVHLLKHFAKHNFRVKNKMKKIVLEQSRGIPRELKIKKLLDKIAAFENVTELQYNVASGNIFDDDYADDFGFFGKLPLLNSLEFNLSWKSATQVLSMLVREKLPIQNLILRRGSIDDKGISYITQMKQLTVLKLCDIEGFRNEDRIKLAADMGGQLTNLQFEG